MSESIYTDKKTGHSWQPYQSSAATIGDSLRYSQAFTSAEEKQAFKAHMKENGVTVTWVRSTDGNSYAYVRTNDDESVAALRRYFTASHAQPSLFGRLKALFVPSGKGLVAGSTVALAAGAGALLTGASPAEAAAVTGEHALSAMPGAGGLLAPNADEARIRNQVDAAGLAIGAAGTWLGGAAGSPVPIIGNALAAAAGGAISNVVGNLAADTWLRTIARYWDDKTETVAPSAGEQVLAAGAAAVTPSYTALAESLLPPRPAAASTGVKLAVANVPQAAESANKPAPAGPRPTSAQSVSPRP